MNKPYAFYINDNEVELKQYLNLSEAAWLVIEDDIKNFFNAGEKESFSGFLNRVFRNFYQSADASINLRAMAKREQLQRLYDSAEFAAFDKDTIDLFIDKYTNLYETELKQKAHSYPNGHGERFRINKENLVLLRELNEAHNYDNLIGAYLKAIFEEYVTKPNYVREQIFFGDTLNKINAAIARQVKLKIELTEKVNMMGNKKYTRKYYFSPYRVVQDKTNTFNYVIGYSEKIVDKVETDESGITRKTSYSLEKTPACLRLSRIAKCDLQVSMGAKISKEHANELDKMLIERDAMFMSSEPIEIKIRFTEKGLESFKSMRYMRPQFYTVDTAEKLLYTFRCTEMQAINYFFKFGWDAFIVEPDYLSAKFKSRYERALKSYQGMSKEEILLSEKKE